MSEEIESVDVVVLSELLKTLNTLAPDARKRIIQSIATLYGVGTASPSAISPVLGNIIKNQTPRTSFSEDRSLSPKDFVWQKQPKTAIERVVCLAYYLQH